MNLSFTEEQDILRKFAAEFLNGKFPKKVIREIEASEEGYAADAWKEMVELGWLGLPFEDKYGGAGMNFIDLAVLLEEIGKAAMPGPYVETVVFGASAIADFGTEEQKQKYLPEVAAGNAILTLALYEDSAIFDAKTMTTKAVNAGNDWVINGSKMFVPFAHVANYFICVAKTDDKADAKNSLTVFIVDAKSPGITMENLDVISGRMSRVIFKDVKVPAENVLGKVNEGFAVAKSVLIKSEAAICMLMAGMAQQAFDMTVQYAKDRMQFGKPIGTFQIIQHYCADMFIELDGMKLGAYQAAWKVSEGLDAEEEVAIAKSWAVKAANIIMALSHQVHGAIGSTLEYDLHFYTRGLKAGELMFGGGDAHRELIAQKLGL
jgi:alkylation response protein AidB-like acyl-CoA dehydrogenase